MADLANKTALLSDLTSAGPRVAKLREELEKESLDGFLIPRADEHQGEFVAPYAERLRWLTGFTGSAGIAAVLAHKAVLMSDGRYTIQMELQVDKSVFALQDSTKLSLGEWLAQNAAQSAVIGYDPKLHTSAEIGRLQKAGAVRGITFKPSPNLIDRAWEDQPAPPQAPLFAFSEKFSGRTRDDKIQELAGKIEGEGGAATILTMPESLVWLLNIRGGDVKHVPYALATMIVEANGAAHLFADSGKISDEVRSHLDGKVQIHPPADFESVLESVVKSAAGKPILLDSAHAPIYYAHLVEKLGGKVQELPDPVLAVKAIKTDAEKAAIRTAHIYDGVAVVKFLEWLDREGLSGHETEISAADRLESFRAEEAAYREASFETIAGSGPNGAIVHYRATEESNRTLEPGTLFLVDSGAQYYGADFTGTTDITRTIAMGKPSSAMKRHFTLVLKGHIGLARAQFPVGTLGAQVDVFARQPLWEAGIDFDHGTGHGVGCFLGVHEYVKTSISRNGLGALEEGMLISNEPGYYEKNAYGIRIENLILVEKRQVKDSGREWLGFETVTLAPIDRRLIDASLLSKPEVQWLNDYHARVRKTLLPLLDAQRQVWLEQATEPLPFP